MATVFKVRNSEGKFWNGSLWSSATWNDKGKEWASFSHALRALDYRSGTLGGNAFSKTTDWEIVEYEVVKTKVDSISREESMRIIRVSQFITKLVHHDTDLGTAYRNLVLRNRTEETPFIHTFVLKRWGHNKANLETGYDVALKTIKKTLYRKKSTREGCLVSFSSSDDAMRFKLTLDDDSILLYFNAATHDIL